MNASKVAIILKGYPRLSETFIAQEIAALEKHGLDLSLVSLRHPTDPFIHPVHEEIKAAVNYLPEYLHNEPLRVVKGLFGSLRLAGFGAACKQFARDLWRDRSVNRIRRFGQALVLANEMANDVTLIYAHFLHTPSSVARYVAKMRALPWSFSAHARDIWTIPDWEKREKLSDAFWGATCTAYGHAHLAGLVPQGERNKIFLSYHGIELERFSPPPVRTDRRDGGSLDEPVIIVSVGRAVAKKGYDTLLAALALLPSHLHWRFVHVGGGELTDRLKQQARSLGLDDRIDWLGAQAQSLVLDTLKQGDIFALACRVDKDGDRDGLPNVLMEAMSQKLVCVSTTISAIPELIENGKCGVLVEPDRADALAEAMADLIEQPDLRISLGEAGYVRVTTKFTHQICIANLLERFGLHDKKRMI